MFYKVGKSIQNTKHEKTTVFDVAEAYYKRISLGVSEDTIVQIAIQGDSFCETIDYCAERSQKFSTE